MFIYSIVSSARAGRADCRQIGQVRVDAGGEVVGQHFGDVVADFCGLLPLSVSPCRSAISTNWLCVC
jgi:hypothetical protein